MNILKNIEFLNVLSTKSVFGVIWKAKYNNTLCAIKMLILKSGIHNNGINYVNKDNNKLSKKTKFPHTSFNIDQYYQRRPISLNRFEKEVEHLKFTDGAGYGPKYYNSFIYKLPINELGKMHIGFIIMGLVDCDLDDVLRIRNLSKFEDMQIFNLITKMHQHLVHRDLKPANIGVWLNTKRQITRAVILDCDKALYKSQLNQKQYDKLKSNDKKRYNGRYRKAIQNR